MKHIATTLLVLTATALSVALHAAVPLKWTVETSRLQPVAFDAVRGETLALEASFYSYGTALELSSNAALYYQTNGMGTAWWEIPATVNSNRIAAVFAPTNDPGAALVIGFLGSSGDVYRAAFTLRFRNGPGAAPNVLPIPKVNYNIALTGEPTINGTNLTDFVASRTESDPHAPGIVSNIVTKSYVEDLGISGGGGGSVPDNAVVLTNSSLQTKAGTAITAANVGALSLDGGTMHGNIINYDESTTPNQKFTFQTSGDIYAGYSPGWSSLQGTFYGNRLALLDTYDLATGWKNDLYLYGNGFFVFIDGPSSVGSRVEHYFSLPVTSGVAQNETLASRSDLSSATNAAQTAATAAITTAITAATNAAQTAATAAITTAITAATNAAHTAADAAYYPKAQGDAWSTYWDGDDVRVTVTNYDSTVNLPSLSLEQRTNETALATNLFKTVWREMSHWDTFLGTNWNWRTSWSGFKTWMENITTELAEKADRAWGFYDSHTGEYSPDGYTVISSSNVMIAAGMSYQKTVTTSSEVWVLTANEPYDPTGVSTNGGFQIKDSDGNVQFEIIKGDKVTVAAQANAATVTNSTLYVVYNIIAAQHPTAQICLDLGSAGWKSEDAADCPATVSWSGSSGAYVAAITPKSSTSSCFAKATYQRGGDTYINNRCAVGMSQLVLNGTTYNLGTATIDGNTVLTLTPAN